MTQFPQVRLEYTGRHQFGRTLWCVMEPMGVDHPELPAGFQVPAAWLTDLASVPRWFLTWWVAGGKAPAAAVVHDWLYCDNGVSRAAADRIFRDLVQREGYAAVTAYLMWSAVRVGGWHSWNKYRRG